MSNIIHLLPDSVANQIAAGEVVQRPGSAVKELLENSIDAGASEINLVIKNAGKTLIRVIDNGSGMSEADTRMCIERHATSKISLAEDLFSLKTMGFRGEAIPSIAAISQMEIKSKRAEDDLGNHLIMEGSEVISHEPCQATTGTSISVKNLFFNIPARRNFLKSNPIETKHIIEEFIRVALIHPEVNMNMDNDGNEVYRLAKGSFRQRIVAIFGSRYNQRLVPVDEKTDIVKISGFIGKPEFARKTRGEQYFFVNKRFIRSAYLNHAVQMAYEELLPKDQYASYFLYMEVDPSKIDINIHPTKTEVKFEEERAIYAIIRTAVRQALGKFNIAPSLDFEQESSFDVPILKAGESVSMPQVKVDPTFNPFQDKKRPTTSHPVNQGDNRSYYPKPEQKLQDWEKLFQSDKNSGNAEAKSEGKSEIGDLGFKHNQLHKKYILSPIKSGFIIVDQQRAHERILIESLSQSLANTKANSQQLLFPEEIELNQADFQLVQDLADEFRQLGFDLNPFGKSSFVVHGLPSGSDNKSAAVLMDEILDEYKHFVSELKNKPRIALVHALAKSLSIKSGKKLEEEEMKNLIDELFACEMPYTLPNGKPIVINYSLEELDKKFKRG